MVAVFLLQRPVWSAITAGIRRLFGASGVRRGGVRKEYDRKNRDFRDGSARRRRKLQFNLAGAAGLLSRGMGKFAHAHSPRI